MHIHLVYVKLQCISDLMWAAYGSSFLFYLIGYEQTFVHVTGLEMGDYQEGD